MIDARPRRVLRLVLLAAATALTVMAGEMALRIVDGYALSSLRLVAKPGARTDARSAGGKWLDPAQAAVYVHGLPVASGVERSWYELDPAPPREMPIDPEINRRYWADAGYLPAGYEWNVRFLTAVVCDPQRYAHPFLSSRERRPRDVFAFEPIDRSAYPTYRFLRNRRYPSGLVTNRFGWRGPDVTLNKPAGRVRLAFVGASTTVGAHDDPFSYPEYIGRWLEVWSAARHSSVTFDVVNAGREGITSRSIAAIVDKEVAPVRPDLVVYYEGSNEFWPNAFVPRPLMRVVQTMGVVSAVEQYSTTAIRIRRALAARNRGHEPAKPPLPVRWPADLSETSPSLADSRLPVALPEILSNLDRIRAAIAPHRGTLIPSSFVWLVYPEMVLEPSRDASLYQYLNGYYWPFSYAHLRRYADFQNRVFAKYAAAHDLPFNDLASVYPRDPRLFTDAIHTTAAGTKLKAWLVFQQLVPEIERRLADGRLPVADPGGRAAHPAFADEPRLVQLDDVRRQCGTSDGASQ